MSRAPYVSVRELLANPATAAGRLMTIGRRLAGADEALRELLPAPLAGHVSVARLSDEGLTLVADSPVWAARLRYETPRILDHLRTRLDSPRLETVRVVTHPAPFVREPAESPAAEPPPRRTIAPESAELIESVALTCGDGDLRRALLRLARRSRARPSD